MHKTSKLAKPSATLLPSLKIYEKQIIMESIRAIQLFYWWIINHRAEATCYDDEAHLK